MLEITRPLVPISPFAGLPKVRTPGGGVSVSTYDNLGIASVLAKKNKETELAERVQQRYGIRLPQTPAYSDARGIAFIATGPQCWLATAEAGGYAFSTSLRHAAGDLASISDQSDGYVVLRLAGAKVRETLSKLVPIDVHPRAFPVGMAVVTVAAHIGVTMWRVADEVGATSAFELALYRSMVGSFWHVLWESAAEFGVELTNMESTNMESTHTTGWRSAARRAST